MMRNMYIQKLLYKSTVLKIQTAVNIVGKYRLVATNKKLGTDSDI